MVVSHLYCIYNADRSKRFSSLTHLSQMNGSRVDLTIHVPCFDLSNMATKNDKFFSPRPPKKHNKHHPMNDEQLQVTEKERAKVSKEKIEEKIEEKETRKPVICGLTLVDHCCGEDSTKNTYTLKV